MRRCCVRWHRLIFIIFAERRGRIQPQIDNSVNNDILAKTADVRDHEHVSKMNSNHSQLEAPVSAYQQNLLLHSGTLRQSLDRLFSNEIFRQFFSRACLLVVGFYNNNNSLSPIENTVFKFQSPPRHLWSVSADSRFVGSPMHESMNSHVHMVGGSSTASLSKFASLSVGVGHGHLPPKRTAISKESSNPSGVGGIYGHAPANEDDLGDDHSLCDLSNCDMVVMSSSTVINFLNTTNYSKISRLERECSVTSNALADSHFVRPSSVERVSSHVSEAPTSQLQQQLQPIDNVEQSPKIQSEKEWIDSNINAIEEIIRSKYMEDSAECQVRSRSHSRANSLPYNSSFAADTDYGEFGYPIHNTFDEVVGFHVVCPLCIHRSITDMSEYNKSSPHGKLFLVFSVSNSSSQTNSCSLTSSSLLLGSSLIEAVRNVAVVMRGEDLFARVGKSLLSDGYSSLSQEGNFSSS